MDWTINGEVSQSHSIEISTLLPLAYHGYHKPTLGCLVWVYDPCFCQKGGRKPTLVIPMSLQKYGGHFSAKRKAPAATYPQVKGFQDLGTKRKRRAREAEPQGGTGSCRPPPGGLGGWKPPRNSKKKYGMIFPAMPCQYFSVPICCPYGSI